MLGPWNGLTVFLSNPWGPLDNNMVERQLRDMVVGRKNHYGSKSLCGTEVAALFYSLIETARLRGEDLGRHLLRAALAAIANPGTLSRSRPAPTDVSAHCLDARGRLIPAPSRRGAGRAVTCVLYGPPSYLARSALAVLSRAGSLASRYAHPSTVSSPRGGADCVRPPGVSPRLGGSVCCQGDQPCYRLITSLDDQASRETPWLKRVW